MKKTKKASQADFLKVRDHMIEPLLKIYNSEINEYMRDAIADDLAGFTVDELDQAMGELRRTQKRMPTPAHLIEACNAARASSRKTSHCDGQTRLPAHDREDQVKQMVKTYLKHYELSALWKQAYSEGWDIRLWRYLYSVAEVQAQFIVGGTDSWYFNSIVIFDAGKIDNAMLARFKADQQQQARTGMIDVAVPSGFIQKWRKEALERKSKSPARPVSAEFTATDTPKKLADSLEDIF